MTRKAPLVYLRGIVPGRYLPEWPVFVVGDDPAGLTFHVSIDDHTVFGQSDSMFGDEGAEARRAYVTVQARQRLRRGAVSTLRTPTPRQHSGRLACLIDG